MKQYFVRYACLFSFFVGFQVASMAQLFDDLEKRENASNNNWVFGVDLGGMLNLYSIGVETSPSNPFFMGSNYLAPGFHVGGVVLRSFDGLKVGGAVSFQRFVGKDDLIILQILGTPASDFNYDVFREVSLNLLNFSARGEFPVMSSVEGGLFIVGDFGMTIISGDFPGNSVSPPLRGAFGIAYEIRLTDETNLQLEAMTGFTRFRNEMEGRELTHFLITSCLSAGIRF